MKPEQLKEAKRLENIIQFNKDLLASLDMPGFWNIKMTTNGLVSIYINQGSSNIGNYEIRSLESLGLEFVKKMKGKIGYELRKCKKELAAL